MRGVSKRRAFIVELELGEYKQGKIGTRRRWRVKGQRSLLGLMIEGDNWAAIEYKVAHNDEICLQAFPFVCSLLIRGKTLSSLESEVVRFEAIYPSSSTSNENSCPSKVGKRSYHGAAQANFRAISRLPWRNPVTTVIDLLLFIIPPHRHILIKRQPILHLFKQRIHPYTILPYVVAPNFPVFLYFLLFKILNQPMPTTPMTPAEPVPIVLQFASTEIYVTLAVRLESIFKA